MNNNNINNTNNSVDRRGLTTLAFLIGMALIDGLNSTEQSAVGNFIMLIGQTLCTNGSYTFNDDWHNNVSPDTLKKAGDIINNSLHKL